MIRRISILFLLLFAGLCIDPGRAHAQSPVTYQAFDVAIDLAADGSFHVTMTQRIRFDGEFSTAFFEIPTAYTGAIRNVTVRPLDGPPTGSDFAFDVRESGNAVLLEWRYPRTTPGEVRTFVIEFDVMDGIWVYPEGDILRWDAVNADRSGVPIEAASVTVTLPDAVSPQMVEYTADGGAYRAEIAGHTITFTLDEPLPDGRFFNVEVTVPPGLLDATVQPWQKAADEADLEVAVERLTVDLAVDADGALTIHERLDLQVVRSILYDSYRTLRLLYLDAVEEITVAVDGAPLEESQTLCSGCYTVTTEPRPASWAYFSERLEQVIINEERSGATHVDWSFAPVPAGQDVRFDLRYQVEGALRVDENSQVLVWDVLPDYGVPLTDAQLRITLPPGVALEQATVESRPPAATVNPQPDGSLLLRYAPGAQTRPRWQVTVTLPPDATTAVKPLWQTDLERVLLEQESFLVAQARRQTTWTVAGILAGIAALLGLVVAWFRWGRTRVREQLGGYLSEPPSSLNAGVVAYLVERDASTRGLLAAIFELAALGVIAVDMDDGFTITRRQEQELMGGSRMTTLYGEKRTVAQHLGHIFNRVIKPHTQAGRPVTLATLAPHLSTHAPQIYALMAGDAQAYFLEGAGRTRPRLPLQFVFFGVWFFAIFYVITARPDPDRVLPLMIGAFAIVFVGTILSQFLERASQARYSDVGKREAERWRKFRVYLRDLQRYGDLGAAQDILDRYFAYAVALGVAEEVLEKAETLGAAQPVWLPAPVGDGGSTTPGKRDPNADRPPSPARPGPRGRPSARPASGGSSMSLPRPSLSGMSRSFGAALGAASGSMAGMLDRAAGSAPTTVTIQAGTQRRELSWEAGTPVTRMADDIMQDSMQATNARIRELRTPARTSSGGSGSSWSSSSSRSSGGFGRRSGSSSSRSSSSRRSGGGGRSGFG